MGSICYVLLLNDWKLMLIETAVILLFVVAVLFMLVLIVCRWEDAIIPANVHTNPPVICEWVSQGHNAIMWKGQIHHIQILTFLFFVSLILRCRLFLGVNLSSVGCWLSHKDQRICHFSLHLSFLYTLLFLLVIPSFFNKHQKQYIHVLQ